MFLDRGWKPESLEETHAHTGRVHHLLSSTCLNPRPGKPGKTCDQSWKPSHHPYTHYNDILIKGFWWPPTILNPQKPGERQRACGIVGGGTADRNITFTYVSGCPSKKAQEWIRSHSLEAKCFVGCEMGNLSKPVFFFGGGQLHTVTQWCRDGSPAIRHRQKPFRSS